MPLSVTLIGFILSLLLKSKKIFFVSFAILYFFSLGLTADLLISYLEKPYKMVPLKKIKNVDSIVVLGGMRVLTHNNQDLIEWHDPDRFFAGIKLYKEGKGNRIIFTDGYNPFLGSKISEGVLNKKDAISIGIPPNSIMITGKASNTFEESQELRKLFNKKNFLNNEIILVTSAFHMKRAKNLFERADFKVLEFPVDFKQKCSKIKSIHNIFCLFPNSYSLKNSSMALREILGRLTYRIN